MGVSVLYYYLLLWLCGLVFALFQPNRRLRYGFIYLYLFIHLYIFNQFLKNYYRVCSAGEGEGRVEVNLILKRISSAVLAHIFSYALIYDFYNIIWYQMQ